MNKIISLFVEHLGVSQNTLKSLTGKRTKKGYWNPETAYKDHYKVKVKEGIDLFCITDLNLDPVWISYFPILGGEPEQDIHGSKKFVKKKGFDVDNYSGMTKMIQDKLNKDYNVILKDDPTHLVGVCFNKHHKDKSLKVNGYIIVIEQLTDIEQLPDLQNHKEIFKTTLIKVKEHYGKI